MAISDKSSKLLFRLGGWCFGLGAIGYLVVFNLVWSSYVDAGPAMWHWLLAIPTVSVVIGCILINANAPQRKVTDYV